MKKIILLTLLFASILGSDRAIAQFIQISDIDTTTFPKLWVTFTARDEKGNPYLGLKTSDFTIWDNGAIVPESRKELECAYPPANVVLCIDQSSSMLDPIQGVDKWEWVKTGVQEFLKNMQMSDSAKAALISFGNEVHLRTPFTKDKKEILDSLEIIKPFGATNFNSPFLDTIGAINQLKKMDPRYRRIIIFLTDGDHDYGHYEDIYRDSIIKLLRNANIQLYAIQIINPMNSDLADIVQGSGGKSFVVYSQEELRQKYSEIAYGEKGVMMCYLKWTTDYICMEHDAQRTAQIYFSKLPQYEYETRYRLPWTARAFMEPYDTTYVFDDPAPGEYVDRTIRLTARHAQQTIKKIAISPSQYFQIINWSGPGIPGNTNIPVPADQSYYVTVRFTQGDARGVRQAMLQVDAEPCDFNIPLKGGLPEIEVTNPKSGDIFTDCQEIDVRWDHVAPNIGVHLDYSKDKGVTWTRFATNVNGNSYKWLPGFTSDNLRIRAEVADNPALAFLNSFGSSKDEYPTGLGVNSSGSYVYVAGNFNDKLNLGGTDLKTYGSRDMFLMKANSDGGVVWATTAGSALADSCAGIVVDAEGNIFMLGIAYKNTYLDSYLANQNAFDRKAAIVIAKYTPAGGLSAVKEVAAQGSYPDFEVKNLKLGINQITYTEPTLYVEGLYKGNLMLTAYMGFKNKDTSAWHPFTTVFNRDLGIDTIYSQGETSFAKYRYSTMTLVDAYFNRYETGSYSDTLTVYGKKLRSNGARDFYLGKSGLHPKSVFTTGDFIIAHPAITFGLPKLQLGDCLLGDTCVMTLPLKLKNTSKAPTKITKIELPQNDYNAFMVDSSMIGTIIPGLDSVTFTIKFNPIRSGYLNGILTVGAECASDLNVAITAFGRCEVDILSSIDVGKVFVNDSGGVHVDCLIRNNNKLAITVRISKIGQHPGEFLVSPSPDFAVTIPPGECKPYDISFLPKYLGKRSMTLQYNINPSCGNAITDVFGEGIEDGVHLDLDGVVWIDPRRVRSQNDSVAVIHNRGNLDANITSIRFENANGEAFTGKLPETPFQLKAKTDIEIPIAFIPEREGETRGALIVEYDDMPQQLRGGLLGYGWLPEMVLTWDCGEDIKPGQETTAKLFVANTAKFSSLAVNKIDLDESTGEFAWPTGVSATNFVVPPDTAFVFDVRFTPQASQTHTAQFNAFADNFDATFPGEWLETPYIGGCGEINLAFKNPVAAPPTVVCGTSLAQAEVVNMSEESSLMIYAAQSSITGPDSDAFAILGLTEDLAVAPKTKALINIAFTPDRFGAHNATLNLANSYGIPILISLSGESEKIALSAEKKNYQTLPGDVNALNVRANIPALGSGKLDSLAINLETNFKSIAFVRNTIKSSVQNWSWSEPTYVNGAWRTVGRGSLNVPFDGELFTVKFLTLLDTSRVARITGSVDYGCAMTTDELSDIEIGEVCFQNGRLIIIPGDPFALSVVRSPGEGMLDVNYNLGFDCEVKLVLFNSMGEEAYRLEDGPRSVGKHRVVKELSAIPSGVYWLRIVAGPYVETIRVDVVK
ncbi:MAG: choice-of-anchor D domain-containing protein [Chloroflexota bacterium]